MKHIRLYLLLATVCRILYSLTIVRDDKKYDKIKNISKKTCREIKGKRTTSDCKCPKKSRTFMSEDNGEPKCYSNKDAGCSSWGKVLPSSCDKKDNTGIFVWNLTMNDNKSIGSWVNITTEALKHVVIKRLSNGVTIGFNGDNMPQWQGQLLKLVLECTDKCYLKKVNGQRMYPLSSAMFNVVDTSTYAPTRTIITRTTEYVSPSVTGKENTSPAPTTVTTTTRTTVYVPPAVTGERKGGSKVVIIVSVVVIPLILIVIIILVLYLFRHRLCNRNKPESDAIKMSYGHGKLEKTQSPVYATVINPESDYQTIAPTNDSVHIEPRDDVYYSSTHSPGVASDASSAYTPLNDFNSSPYSALSPTDSDASIHPSKLNSSWDNTPVNTKLRDRQQIDATEYHELVPDVVNQNTTRIPRTESESTPDAVYFELQGE